MRLLARLCTFVTLVCFAGAGACFGREAWLLGKGLLAGRLIDRAWAETRRDGLDHRPWRWADFHPVGRLRAPGLGIERAVLSQSAGSALAFGLGHVAGSAPPGFPGGVVLAAHRDTWGAFLRRLHTGDTLVFETAGGDRTYRVEALDVVHERDVALLDGGEEDSLTILTCWPFGALRRGPWRLALRAVPLRSADRARTPCP